MQVVDDLVGDVGQAGLVSGIAGRDVIIGRIDGGQEGSACIGAAPLLPAGTFAKSQPEKGLSR